jgi:O-Antigen ligase
MNDLIFYFEGVQRLDWGLGNPNKTATLIAELMILVWALSFRKRPTLFYCAAILFTVLGCCLALTYSRGGFVACAVGISLLLYFSPWTWTKMRKVVFLLCVGVMAGYMVYSGASRRYVQGIRDADPSIQSRLEIWKMAPRMMVDAPHGWGLGQSGQAYLQWYQPLESDRGYRTLVNSHLTWLVEGGWGMRYLYLAGWIMAFVVCFVKRENRVYPIPLGVWSAFALSATFSSVAEAFVLWLIPVACLLGALWIRVQEKQWITKWQALLMTLLPLIACMILYNAGSISNPLRIKKTRQAIIVGSGGPAVWLVMDTQRFTSESWARTLRGELHKRGAGFCVAIGDRLQSLTYQSPKRIVIWGRPSNIDSAEAARHLPLASQLVLYAPQFYPQEAAADLRVRLRTATVYFGEFSQSAFLSSWENETEIKRVPASGDYFPRWTDLLFAE